MSRARSVLLDMEGVLHVDWRAIPGSPQAVSDLRAAGVELAVLTNTTGRTRRDISALLDGMGIQMPAERVVTAASATAAWVAAEHPGAAVHLLGEQGAAAEFAGIELVDDPAAAAVIVVAGPTAELAYPDLDRAFRALLGGAVLVAMQKNRWWPTAAGPAMDAGGLVAALEYAADVRATVVAKPNPAIFQAALEVLGSQPGDTVMVGDDLRNDLSPAAQLGMHTCLVRTGKGAAFSPDPGEVTFVEDDLAALARRLLS